MKKRIAAAVLACVMSLSLFGCGTSQSASADAENTEESVRIGIAWRSDTDSEFYINICQSLEEAGAETVLLDEVMDEDLTYEDGSIAADQITENDYLNEEAAELVKENTYQNSNVEEVFEDADVDAVIFTGGEDISPTLTAVSTDWHHIEEEKDYNATRDVSDYLLMSYCIDEDIPVMGFCRGMQMLAVVSGGSMIQDIPTFFEENNLTYHDEHRNVKETPESYRDYSAHDVTIVDEESNIYEIFGTDTLSNVPSWHHQAVLSVEGTPLEVTAVAETDGYDIIESIERTDKTMIMGFQFHPEAAIVKNLSEAENAGDYMDEETALKVFEYLMDAARQQSEEAAA